MDPQIVLALSKLRQADALAFASLVYLQHLAREQGVSIKVVENAIEVLPYSYFLAENTADAIHRLNHGSNRKYLFSEQANQIADFLSFLATVRFKLYTNNLKRIAKVTGSQTAQADLIQFKNTRMR